MILELYVCSVEFAAALKMVGARVNTVLYPGKSHTDLFLQVSPWCLLISKSL